MVEVHHLHSRFCSALGIIQESLCDLLELLSIQHNAAKSQDPNIALRNIFEASPNLIKLIKSLKYPCNYAKFFDGPQVNPPDIKNIKNSINISHLDVTSLVEVLTVIKEFPTYPRQNILKTLKKKKCQGVNHQNVAKCCPVCDHKCVICLSNPCSGKCCIKNEQCNHDCQKCYMKQRECRSNSTICCDTCLLCFYCTNSLVKVCAIFNLQKAIPCCKKFRNATAHLTCKEYAELELGNFALVEFYSCNNWNWIWKLLFDAINSILTYICSTGHPGSGNTKFDRLEDMKMVLNEPIDVILEHFDTNITLTEAFNAEQDDLKKVKYVVEELSSTIKGAKDEANETDLVLKENLIEIKNSMTVLTEGITSVIKQQLQKDVCTNTGLQFIHLCLTLSSILNQTNIFLNIFLHNYSDKLQLC